MHDRSKGAMPVIAAGDRLIGARDPMGIRPLCISELSGNYILASESVAFDTIELGCCAMFSPGR